MKRTIAPTLLAAVFATVFFVGIVPRAEAGVDKECSDVTLRSSFGYTSTGTLLDTYARPLLLALSLRSVGRPSTGKVILTQPRH
jgi:hypothetical protein